MRHRRFRCFCRKGKNALRHVFLRKKRPQYLSVMADVSLKNGRTVSSAGRYREDKVGMAFGPQAVDLAAALVALSGACLTNLLHGSFTVTSSPGLSPDSVSLPHPQRGKPETLSIILDFYCSMKCEEFLSMAQYFSTAQFAQRTPISKTNPHKTKRIKKAFFPIIKSPPQRKSRNRK